MYSSLSTVGWLGRGLDRLGGEVKNRVDGKEETAGKWGGRKGRGASWVITGILSYCKVFEYLKVNIRSFYIKLDKIMNYIALEIELYIICICNDFI